MQNTLRKLKSNGSVQSAKGIPTSNMVYCSHVIKEERKKERLVYTRPIIQDVRFALSVAIRMLGRGLIRQYYDGRCLIKYS
jgi:hypothetical protein